MIQEYNERLKKKLLNDLSYSFRRYYVDDFMYKSMKDIPEESYLLDIGGKKLNKRGEFNIEDYNLSVKYANIDSSTNPDFLCDSSSVPVPENSFDVVVLSEVLEHLENPMKTLNEAYRILRPGGKMLLCTPFMFHVHGDPQDYARYTDYWYEKVLTQINFKNIKIEKQGLFFSVLANQVKLLSFELNKQKRPKNYIKRKVLHNIKNFLIKKSFIWDHSILMENSLIFQNTTTGYGITCEK